MLKALIIKLGGNVDLGDLVAVARSEGQKVFRTKRNVRVVDVVWRPYGWVVVVEFRRGPERRD